VVVLGFDVEAPLFLGDPLDGPDGCTTNAVATNEPGDVAELVKSPSEAE